MAEAATLFFQVEALERRIQITKESIDNYQQSLDLVETRYERGLIPILDVRQAKRLLAQKGTDFNEVGVDFDAGARAEMRERAGGRNTVPQIFIDGQHIGGCDELMALDRDGGLDPLLAA